jgi:hypothetical protein
MIARISRPAKNAMQSGRGKMDSWIVEFEADAVRTRDPLMGWTSAAETATQVKLIFETREDAIAYCQRNSIAHRVVEPKQPKRIPRAYSDNFAFSRKEPWSH